MPLAALTSGSQNDPLMAKLVSQLPALPGVPNLAPFQQQKQQIQKQQQELTAPSPPQLQQIPQDVPKAQVTDAFSQMSMPMLFLATLAGGLTAHPMQGAFQNAASYLQGLHQGDQEATKNAYTEFTTKLNAAKDANAQAVDQYKMAFEKYGADSEKLKSELSSIADAEGDTVLKHQLEQGQFDDVYKLIDARDRLNQQISTGQLRLIASALGQPQMVETKDGTQVLAQQDKSGLITGTPGQWVTADEKHALVKDVTGAVSATTAGLPSANQGIAEMIAHYEAPPLTGYSLRSASGQQIMADVKKLNPDYNSANYDRIRKTIDDFATGPSSKRVVSLNVAIQHLDTLQSLANALGSGDIRAINAAKQKFELEFGAAAPANFDAVVQIVGKEVVKAIVNGGGGVTERNDAQNAFSRVGSPQQVSGAVSSIKQILAGQLAGLKKQYETQTEGTSGVIPFDKLLLPDTSAQLGAAANAAEGANVAPGPGANASSSQW